MGFREVVRGLVSPTPFMESCGTQTGGPSNRPEKKRRESEGVLGKAPGRLLGIVWEGSK